MLRWFEKDPSDNFVGETQLLGLSLPALQSVFGVEAENLMFDSWSVEDAHLEFLAKHVDVEIDLSKFDYFVEADASTPTDGLEKCRKNKRLDTNA